MLCYAQLSHSLCFQSLSICSLAGKISALKGQGRVFLLAATLRPETMAGQTNCWALPEGKYGAFRGLNDEIYVVTERAALNLAYQVRMPECVSGSFSVHMQVL